METRPTTQLSIRQLAEQRLTQDQFQKMERWNHRLAGPYAMLPTAYREGSLEMTEERYQHALRETGDWMDSYMRRQMKRRTREQIAHRGPDPLPKNVRENGTCLHFGVGVGRGMEYLGDAYDAGYDIQIYDWSEVALEFARKELLRILAALGEEPDRIDLPAIIMWAEAEELFNSSDWSDEARYTRIAQLGTLLEHQDLPRVERIIFGVGKMLSDSQNQLVVIDTPLEGNEQFGRTTSERRPEKWMEEFLLEILSGGARTTVQCIDQAEHTPLEMPRLKAWTFRGT